MPALGRARRNPLQYYKRMFLEVSAELGILEEGFERLARFRESDDPLGILKRGTSAQPEPEADGGEDLGLDELVGEAYGLLRAGCWADAERMLLRAKREIGRLVDKNRDLIKQRPTDDSPAPRFQGGERVVHKDGSGLGTVRSASMVYDVAWDDPDDLGGDLVFDEDLKPAPAALPEDHLDRFWIPGAWFYDPSDPEFYWIVLSDTEAALIGSDPDCGACVVARHAVERDTSYAFHPDSPVQEPREL